MVLDLSRSPLVFVLPAGHEAPSGGNIYNRELTRALAELVPITVTGFADASSMIAAGRPGLYVFDTLELEKTRTLPARRSDQSVGIVVHHLPSLEPGISAGDPALATEAEALAGFDLFIATSDFTHALLTSRGHDERAILTVPPALRRREVPGGGPPLSTAVRSYEAPLSALLVANLIPRKGVLPLLETLAELGKAPSPYTLRIVGRLDMDPEYVAACRRVLENSANVREAVSIQGPLPYERMGEVYETSELLVSAASMETFGMAVHEARAHGLPVLARDGGYVRHHFTDGQDGILCASTGELAKKLVELAGDERAMRKLFTEAQARRAPSDYIWADAARRFLSELERVGARPVAGRLLPEAPNLEAFDRVVRDDAALRAGVTRICETLGVNARPERFADGSLPVYALGPELVLKLYPPYDFDEAEREARFLEALDGRLPIATPKLHAAGALEGWGYVLMGRLRGESLVSAWPRIERDAKRRLATKLGEALRSLHALRDPRLETERVEWRAFIQNQKQTTLALQAKRGLEQAWLEQIPEFLERECEALENAPAESPLHTEVMREHLLVEKTDDDWVLSGLFDFEPAMVGAPEYEFGAVGVFFSCGDRELFRSVLFAYGYSDDELDHALERRLLAYALLHKYSNLSWYLSRIPAPSEATSLDHLASHFFGVRAE